MGEPQSVVLLFLLSATSLSGVSALEGFVQRAQGALAVFSHDGRSSGVDLNLGESKR